MADYLVLFNPLAGNGSGEAVARSLEKVMEGDALRFQNITETDYPSMFASMGAEERLLLVGGDGTLNRFVNDTADCLGDREVWYYPGGSGNDFMTDIGRSPDGRPQPIGKYLRGLPRVTVNGQTRRFLNNVGYGIDGYCCEVGDELRKSSDKPVNYAGIAIKGMLFGYHPTKAEVTVDGVTVKEKNVWLAPAMNGRYYGGGMMPAPDQDRLARPQTVSVMLLHGRSRLNVLINFPSIFKGELSKKKKLVKMFAGRDITVRFDSPRALQIDGETILNVSEYRVQAD